MCPPLLTSSTRKNATPTGVGRKRPRQAQGSRHPSWHPCCLSQATRIPPSSALTRDPAGLRGWGGAGAPVPRCTLAQRSRLPGTQPSSVKLPPSSLRADHPGGTHCSTPGTRGIAVRATCPSPHGTKGQPVRDSKHCGRSLWTVAVLLLAPHLRPWQRPMELSQGHARLVVANRDPLHSARLSVPQGV